MFEENVVFGCMWPVTKNPWVPSWPHSPSGTTSVLKAHDPQWLQVLHMTLPREGMTPREVAEMWTETLRRSKRMPPARVAASAMRTLVIYIYVSNYTCNHIQYIAILVAIPWLQCFQPAYLRRSFPTPQLGVNVRQGPSLGI